MALWMVTSLNGTYGIFCVPHFVEANVVVLDNLSSHHRASIRTLIEAQGCEMLFISPDSPDLNPIELMFSKIKALVRGGAWRVIPELLNAIGSALDAVKRLDIEHWFKHAHPQVLL